MKHSSQGPTDIHTSNNIQDIRQNHLTIKYMSL